jgi:hypothetical protein
MKAYDIGSSLFWFFFSVFICFESLSLGLGTPRNPGMGFMAFGTAVLLGCLSLGLFLKSLFERREGKIHSPFSGSNWRRIMVVFIALLIYAWVLPIIGYLLSTFVLMFFLFWSPKKPMIGWSLLISFLSTVGTYYIFAKKFGCQLPTGLLPF